MPPKRTKLNRKSQPVGGTAALSYLLKVRFRQGKVFAESIVVDLIGQAFWLFQPVIRTGIVQTEGAAGFKTFRRSWRANSFLPALGCWSRHRSAWLRVAGGQGNFCI